MKRSASEYIRFSASFVLSLPVLLLIASGCQGPVDPTPFARWSAATDSLAEGANAAANQLAVEFEDRQVERVVNDPAAALMLVLQPNDDNRFAVMTLDEEVSPAVSAERFAVAVAETNAVMTAYADALERLASDKLIDTFALDELAAELNGHLLAATTALGARPSSQQPVGFFTLGARAAAEDYLRKRQRKELVRVLDAHQKTVEALSASSVAAIELIVLEATWTEYQRRSGLVRRMLTDAGAVSADPPPADIAERRRAAARELVALNRAHSMRLEILAKLRRVYAGLPAAHAELRRTVSNEQVRPTDHIRRLAAQGRSLRDLHERLKDAEVENGAASTVAEARPE